VRPQRRRILLLAAGAFGLAGPAGVWAQQIARSRRVGLLLPTERLAAERLALVRERLARNGFVEGRNLAIDMRSPASWTEASWQAAVGSVLALKPDVLLTTTTLLTRAAQAATTSVPIVFTWVGDPVASGIVKEYGRPGGNATGVSLRYFELTAKRLELLRELLPAARRVAALSRVWDDPPIAIAWRNAQAAAGRLGIELLRLDIRIFPPKEVEADAFLILDPFGVFGVGSAMKAVIRYTVEQRIPAIFADTESVEAGGLMSYATNLHGDLRRGADLAARVLRGAKPAELPVDQASRFELAVNLGTARSMGVRIPQPLLLRADRVIE
jgi:putative ABC transport system substrate-binding protein